MTARFLSTLDLRLLNDTSADGRGTWQLLSPLAYYSELLDATFVAPAGFVTDFASVPRWIPVLSSWLQNRAHAAAVMHDWLYTCHSVSRKQADQVLREAGIACGIQQLKMDLYYLGVRAGGASRWDAVGPEQPAAVAQVVTAGALEAP